MSFWQILIACGVPSGLFGILTAYIIRKQVKYEKARADQQHNLETLNFMMLQSTRANTVLCIATAEAVRAGHCNGKMAAALKMAEEVAEEEKKFLLEKGIKYIFE